MHITDNVIVVDAVTFDNFVGKCENATQPNKALSDAVDYTEENMMKPGTPYGKPIKADPVLRGKDAEEFYNRFLKNARLDPLKAERNKRNAEIYRDTPVVRG